MYRMFIIRMMTSGGDKGQYADLAERLAELTLDATFAVSVDTHAMVADTRGIVSDTHTMVADTRAMTSEMQAVLEAVQAQLQYTVRGRVGHRWNLLRKFENRNLHS